ncbi:hypothetical protein LRP30_13400 [Bradyrhizobium sp. C-145]|uniref:hypothetical protein n=1 Tax=Bradyrhizobium sp. C-145 TaxID=574727 RepID=UPI00201B90A0|nr:hypothetical protein [Bradyrhizobium sp. C-145]UQR66182.1 hypothetical protein LRP30_13400 [Bradyrhizobium sp. C-145]
MLKFRLAAFYGVDEPENGKRRGDCAIRSTHDGECSMGPLIETFRARPDIGWIEITDLETNETRREYLR